MKTKSILVAAIVIVASIAFAQESTSKVAVVSQKKSGTFKVIYSGTEGKVKMNIRNSEGETVFTETISGSNGFIRPVNLTGLEFGEYTIEIADAAGKQTQTVSYQSTFVASNVHVAKVAEEGKYLLAVANNSVNQMNVKIFDGENNLIHTEQLTVKGDIGVVYNLKHISGTPTFEVSDNTGAVKTVKY